MNIDKKKNNIAKTAMVFLLQNNIVRRNTIR